MKVYYNAKILERLVMLFGERRNFRSLKQKKYSIRFLGIEKIKKKAQNRMIGKA